MNFDPNEERETPNTGRVFVCETPSEAARIRVQQTMRVVSLLLLISCVAFGAPASDTKGVIGGRVTDPQGSVVAQAQVEIINTVDGHKQTATTGDQGHFEFRYVDVGEYRVLVSVLGFMEVAARVTVTSSQHVEINLELSKVRPISEEINISPASEVLDTRGSSVQTGFSMVDVEHLAGGSESIAGLEAHTGTAWRSQEHLHIRGAHQVGYQVNGINIPDLSIFGAITPFIDMRNIKFTEVTTGGLGAEFGNRTAGVVNTLVRSGFDHGYGNGQIELSGGNLARGSVFAGYGNHRGEKFAYYFQGTALTSGRGFNPPPDAISPLDENRNGQADVLDVPSSQTRHNDRRTFQGFSNLEWRPTNKDSFNFVAGGFRSDFQVPNTISQESLGRDYVQFERDHFENLQWTRLVSPAKVLTA